MLEQALIASLFNEDGDGDGDCDGVDVDVDVDVDMDGLRGVISGRIDMR